MALTYAPYLVFYPSTPAKLGKWATETVFVLAQDGCHPQLQHFALRFGVECARFRRLHSAGDGGQQEEVKKRLCSCQGFPDQQILRAEKQNSIVHSMEQGEEGHLLDAGEGKDGNSLVAAPPSVVASAHPASTDGLLPVPPQFNVATIIVTNIAPTATEQDVRSFFSNCGPIVQLNLLRYFP